jgi:ribosomal protein S28E/S33
MMWQRTSWLCGLAVLALASCGRESPLLESQPPSLRPSAYVEVVRSEGDGSVQIVRSEVLAALRTGNYACTRIGGPLQSGDTVLGRTYVIGAGDAATVIKLTTKNGELVQSSIRYGDENGKRRLVLQNARSPLTGADSVAAPIVRAADLAACEP